MKQAQPVRWLYKNAKQYLAAIALMSVISAVVSVCYVGLALVSRTLIDIATGDASGSIPLQCAFLGGIIIGQILLNVLNSVLRVRISGKLEMSLRQTLFQALLRKRHQQLSAMHSGEILNRFTSDISHVVDGLVTLLPQVVSLLTKILAGLFVLIHLDWFFAVIVLAVGLLMLIASRLYSKRYKALHKRVQESAGVTRSFLQECVENNVVIKSFVTHQPMLKKLKGYMNANFKLKLKRNTVSIVANTGVYLLFTAGYYATLAWGAYCIAVGTMTFGTLTAFLQIVSQIRAPFYNMSGILPAYYAMLASAERLIELEELPQEPFADPPLDGNALYKTMRSIQARRLRFSYADGETVIESADFTVEKNEVVGILGPSGIGKSTLFKLLLGLIDPTGGSLVLQTESGELQIDATLRPLFAYVPQGNMILSGSIRENILFCCPGADDAQLKAAAKAAVIDSFIEGLPDGYDTLLGERGLGLSEGQVQRIAIARAVLSGAPVLLLDECTSALDEATERRLLENLRALRTRTVLFISHRAAAHAFCDRTLQFSGHTVVEETARASAGAAEIEKTDGEAKL